MSLFQFADVTLRGTIGSIDTKEKAGKTMKFLSVAVTDHWKDKDQNPQEHTNWIRVSVFDAFKCEVLEKAEIGQTILITGGSLHSSTFQKEDGTKAYSTEVRLDRNSRLILVPKLTNE